jgi:cell wall assembly regulator SMI1
MKTIWHRIETWLQANAPAVVLNPPASRAEITEAETVLGVTFPPDLVETFLLHNGQADGTPWLLDGWEFMSLERIVDEWTVWKDLLDGGDFDGSHSDSDGATVTDWWHPRWIPLTYDGAGNHHCLDLHPGPSGTAGQIIRMWHDDPSREVLARSYREWLDLLVTAFEAGRYELSEEYGGIVECEP